MLVSNQYLPMVTVDSATSFPQTPSLGYCLCFHADVSCSASPEPSQVGQALDWILGADMTLVKHLCALSHQQFCRTSIGVFWTQFS